MLPILQRVIRLYEKMGYNRFKEENITDEQTFVYQEKTGESV